MKKTGLVLEGGGIRGVFTAGDLDLLNREFLTAFYQHGCDSMAAESVALKD